MEIPMRCPFFHRKIRGNPHEKCQKNPVSACAGTGAGGGTGWLGGAGTGWLGAGGGEDLMGTDQAMTEIIKTWWNLMGFFWWFNGFLWDLWWFNGI